MFMFLTKRSSSSSAAAAAAATPAAGHSQLIGRVRSGGPGFYFRFRLYYFFSATTCILTLMLAQDRVQWWAFVFMVMNFREYLDRLNNFQLLKENSNVGLVNSSFSYLRM
jgi:hypothetical protein